MHFDPEKTDFVINGIVIPMWDELSVSYDNPRWATHAAGNGPGYFGKNPNKNGKFALTMPIVNGVSARLENLAASDATFPASAIDRSDAARHATAATCRLEKVADLDRQGSNPTKEVWNVLTTDLDLGHGAGDPDDDDESIL
jgi:hypothetical protein